jgi:hypothetical protein
MSDGEAGLPPGARHRPWTVLVIRNLVVKVYPWIAREAQRQEMLVTARRVATSSSRIVHIYEVDSRLVAPPSAGSTIDPDALGWIEVGQIEAARR